jgi:hypothetical protein
MRWSVVRRRAALGLSVIAMLLLPVRARAQWELWLGGWMVEPFGVCGGVGCFAGQNLCAVVSSAAGPSYCYER